MLASHRPIFQAPCFSYPFRIAVMPVAVKQQRSLRDEPHQSLPLPAQAGRLCLGRIDVRATLGTEPHVPHLRRLPRPLRRALLLPNPKLRRPVLVPQHGITLRTNPVLPIPRGHHRNPAIAAHPTAQGRRRLHVAPISAWHHRLLWPILLRHERCSPPFQLPPRTHRKTAARTALRSRARHARTRYRRNPHLPLLRPSLPPHPRRRRPLRILQPPRPPPRRLRTRPRTAIAPCQICGLIPPRTNRLISPSRNVP